MGANSISMSGMTLLSSQQLQVGMNRKNLTRSRKTGHYLNEIEEEFTIMIIHIGIAELEKELKESAITMSIEK